MPRVPFVDLGRQYEGLRDEIVEAIDRVSRSGAYVLGPDVEAFERAFADYCGVAHGISMGNGSDALHLPLLARAIGQGDEVITAPNSFVASAWTIARTGAKVVFADVGEDMNLDPDAVEAAITPRTKAVMVVHLTGRIAKMDALRTIAEKHGVSLIEDAAQAVGAERAGVKAGAFGDFAGFSLHPLKNLHVHGDAGICVTNDNGLAETLRQYRNHGLVDRSECAFWGVNTRMDSIQAAIGLIKLKHLDEWNSRYRSIAKRYTEELSGTLDVPTHGEGELPVYHRYMVRCKRREALQRYLNEAGIGSAVNYPIPLHLQPAAKDLGYSKGSFPLAEQLADEILSLPLYPELNDDEVGYVIETVKKFFIQAYE